MKDNTNSFQNSLLLQSLLPAQFANIVSQLIYGYVSSQELTNGTQQHDFRKRKDF